MIAPVVLEPSPAARHLRPFRFASVAATHPGCVRTLNEDAYLDRPDIGLWAVSDGMGGHASGDVASQTVIAHLNSVANFTTAFHFRHAVRNALMAANAELQKKADDELLDLIGATVVTFMVHHSHFACIWAGDSRAYRLRGGVLQRLTRDHSLAQQLADAGSLIEPDARTTAHSRIVTRAVGAEKDLELDGVYGGIEGGDRFLLCSDGLDVLSDEEIEDRLGKVDLALSAEHLVRDALKRKAPDNISVVVVEAVD